MGMMSCKARRAPRSKNAEGVLEKTGDILANIIVLEDDESVNRGVTFSLEKSNNCVYSCTQMSKAKGIVEDNKIDLVICDINLPDGSGFDFVRWMRQHSDAYIVCLTALDQETDQVIGYEAGADDYVTKPFSLSVLLLKIEAVLKRREGCGEHNKISSGDIEVFTDEMRTYVNGKETLLTKNEWKLLIMFLKNSKQVLSKRQILEGVFDLEGEFVDDNTVAVNIRRLREKIEEDPATPKYLKNIRGLGYIWNQEVR